MVQDFTAAAANQHLVRAWPAQRLIALKSSLDRGRSGLGKNRGEDFGVFDA